MLNFLWFFFLLVLIYLLARPMIEGAVFFPTRKVKMETIISLAGIKPGHKVADLGSGDGRILIACAKAGAVAVGYEINPLLVLLSKWNIRKIGLQDKATVHWKSFWKIDLSSFDSIIVYGIPYIMNRLKTKLEKEARSGVAIVSNIYKIPGWQPTKEENGLYLYVR